MNYKIKLWWIKIRFNYWIESYQNIYLQKLSKSCEEKNNKCKWIKNGNIMYARAEMAYSK